MLEDIFSSRVGTRVVLKMGREAYRQFYLYQLSKELKTGLGRTKTILEMLRRQGVLLSTKNGKRIEYKLNENNRFVYDIIYLAHKDALLKTEERYRSNADRLIGIYKKILGDNLVSAVLFGSVAKGKASEWSDIDILIIIKRNVREKLRDKIHKELSSAVEIYSNISEEHYYTEKEFEESYMIGDDFLINVMKDGIILYDKEYFARYLIRGPPTVTKESIRKRLDFSRQWLDLSFEQYKKFPQGIPSHLGIIAMHLARALLLLNGIIPQSKHEIPGQLLGIKEVKFSKIYIISRKWFDSPPLKVENKKIWQMLAFLREKRNECMKKLEGWA